MGELNGLSYPVVLRPSDVKFTCPTVPTTFDNGERLLKVLDDMCKGRILPKDIPPMNVVWYCDKWEWYTVNNRRLWLFQQLEKREICGYASMNRVETMNTSYRHPINLYPEASLYDPPEERTSTLISNDLLSLHRLEDGQITPPLTDDEDCAMSVLSFTGVAKSPRKRSNSRSRSGQSRSHRRSSRSRKSRNTSASSQSRSRRMRTSSTGTTVGSVEDIYVEKGVTVHARKKYRDDHDDDDDLEIKMEVESIPPEHVRGRSRSKRGGDRSTLVSREPSRGRNRSRVRSRSRGRSQLRGRSRSRGRRDRSSSWVSPVQSPVRSSGVNCSKTKDRNYRSTSVMSTSSFKGAKEDNSPSKSQQFFDQSRSRNSARNTNRNVRAKSVSCLPTGSGSTTLRYNSFQSEGNNSNFRDRSRAKSVSNIRDKPVSDVRDRSRCKSVSALLSQPSRHGSLFSVNTRYRSRSKSVGRTLQGDEGSRDDAVSVYERKRTLSGCSDYSAGRSASDVVSSRRGERESSVSSVKSHRSVKSNASSRSYQLDKFRHEKAVKYQRPRREKFIDNDFTRDYEYTTDSTAIAHRSDSISSGYGSVGSLSVKTGIQLSNLYSLWAARRSEFLEARRKGELHLMYGPEEGYLCGLCFRKFARVVDLQQHCEELLHYACITCGRFFNTYTALGQHCNALRHTKD